MDTDSRLESQFLLLRERGYGVTSPKTTNYNCFGWATGSDNLVLEHGNVGKWPPDLERQGTRQNYKDAFRFYGFEECDNGELEENKEKIAIYSIDGEPQHAARQQLDGTWTSKLGKGHDIMHRTTDAIEGLLYGYVTDFMARSR